MTTSAAASALDAERADFVYRARCGFFGNKLALLPLATCFSLPLTFFISYGIAVGNRHVTPGFPFISDTGTTPPESCVFGQLLNMASVLVALTVYVKYRQLLAAAAVDRSLRATPRFRRANAAALCLGLGAAFGVSLVANFQWTQVLSVHMVGAFLVFVVGIAYGWLLCWLSWCAPPPLCGVRLRIARLLAMAVASLCLLLTVMGASLTKELGFMDYNFVPDPLALLATIAEWVMSFALASMFLTLAVDFRCVKVTSPAVALLFHSSSLTLEHNVAADRGEVDGGPPVVNAYSAVTVN